MPIRANSVGVSLTLSSVRHINPPGLVYRELAGPPTYLSVAVVWRAQGVGRTTQAVLDIPQEDAPNLFSISTCSFLASLLLGQFPSSFQHRSLKGLTNGPARRRIRGTGGPGR